jgi:hypothetical protein
VNPLLELRRLLASKPALQTSGTVIELLRNSMYRVRTASGSIEATASGNAAYASGDEVLILNGVIQGRVKNASAIPVYQV